MRFAEGSQIFDADEPLVMEVLSEYGEITRRRMEAFLPDGEPRPYLYGLLADYSKRGGKMLRSSLCIAMARAVGADLEDAIATAVSIELLHNAILVHDDIQDGSEERRGKPTLHALHGVALAINAGDAMVMLSLDPLKDNFRRLGLACGMRIYEETERVAWESVEGQALELGWQRDNRTDICDEDYLRMVLQKTCWLAAIHPIRMGCLIGSRGRMLLDPLNHLGFFLGAAFQIRDDLLNLEPGPSYGKEVNGDLFEGKRTLMILHALRHANPSERRELVAFMGRERASRSKAEVEWVRALLERTSALQYAATVAQAMVGAALCEFDKFFASTRETRDLRFVRNLIVWVLRRTH